jgi:poly-gamma-glutamate capsule biosynthesis protein CapA/YwtB (metallophosphatase superfamily)
MKQSMKIIALLAILVFFAIAYYLLEHANQTSADHQKKIVLVGSHPERNLASTTKEVVQTATIGALGDILIHDWVYEDAKTDSSYDFKPMFSVVKPILKQPDFLMANQESILGGVELGLSGYPTFNSPQEMGDALIDAGVDFVSNANNHSLDKGERGILSEIAYFHRVGLPYVGSFKDEKDQQTLRIIKVNGIKLAILAYTYGTNGIPLPPGKDYLVNLIDKEKMRDEIHRAKQAADVVIMSVHWGNEYQRLPSEAQKELAQYLVNEGADIIFGHHPHVLQPMDWHIGPNGRKAFVVYSLGNFLSGQTSDYKDIGGLATIEITKRSGASGVKIELSNPRFIPTYVSNENAQNFRVVPLEDAESYGLNNAKEKYEEIMQHMTQWLKD